MQADTDREQSEVSPSSDAPHNKSGKANPGDLIRVIHRENGPSESHIPSEMLSCLTLLEKTLGIKNPMFSSCAMI